MKKIFITIILLFPLFVISQKLHYGSGGTVLDSENKKIKSTQMRVLLENNSEALALYNTGRSKKTFGNVLFYGGFGLIVANVISAVSTDNTTYSTSNSGYVNVESKRASMTVAIIGGVCVVASIPIKIGYPKKIKSALSSYNKGLTDNYKPTQKLTLLASNQQIGFRYEW